MSGPRESPGRLNSNSMPCSRSWVFKVRFVMRVVPFHGTDEQASGLYNRDVAIRTAEVGGPRDGRNDCMAMQRVHDSFDTVADGDRPWRMPNQLLGVGQDRAD